MTAHEDVLSRSAFALLEGRLDDPFALLGPHGSDGARTVRTFQPGAEAVE